MVIKLGSLFDGIGGFPYAGTFYGIIPVWASEIEPWPIKVTEKHFSNMKHLGDITQIDGAEIEPVDVITFGSPCQDLSVAGKREGLAGERSGLFMEAVRIIREMRTATDGKYPRFAVWENVPGAFSSNKGEDFRAVLEEITEAEIPMPGSGKWATAGMVRTERVDIAWRVLDAQYWGVPQRRRRIFLITDFTGRCAAEILFKPESLSRYSSQSGETREEVAATVGNGIETAIPINTQIATRHNKLGRGTGFGIGEDGDPSFTLQEAHSHAVCCKTVVLADQGGSQMDVLNNISPCLRSQEHGHQPLVIREVSRTLRANAGAPKHESDWESLVIQERGGHPAKSGKAREEVAATVGDGVEKSGECLMFENHGQDTRFKGPLDVAQPVTATFGMGGNNQPFVVHKSSYWDGGRTSDCLDCSMLAKGQMMPEKRRFPVVIEPRSQDGVCRIHAVAFQPGNLSRQAGADPSETVFPTLGATTLGDQFPHVSVGYAVRRLTPIECLRLQGFPDYWLDIDGMSDTQKYKAIGNSVAIPCVKFVLGGIARVLGGEKK